LNRSSSPNATTPNCGSLRLAPAFVVGAAFRMVAGSDFAVAQREQLWSSTAAYDSPLTPAVDEHTGLGETLCSCTDRAP